MPVRYTGNYPLATYCFVREGVIGNADGRLPSAEPPTAPPRYNPLPGIVLGYSLDL